MMIYLQDQGNPLQPAFKVLIWVLSQHPHGHVVVTEAGYVLSCFMSEQEAVFAVSWERN